MTIDEAIKTLIAIRDVDGVMHENDWEEACNLGIEALTYITLLRQTDPQLVPALFNEETKE